VYRLRLAPINFYTPAPPRTPFAPMYPEGVFPLGLQVLTWSLRLNQEKN